MSNATERLTARENDEITFRDAWRQIFASCVSFLIVVQVGTSMVYSSVLLPQLELTAEQASWVASLVTVTTPIGAVLAGPLMDRYGRKTLSVVSGIAFVVGWGVIGTGALYQIYVGRVILGMGCGFSTSCLVYCSELSHPTYRPMLLGLNSVCFSLGILITYGFGVEVAWRTQAFFYLGFAAAIVALHWPLPESPHWLPDGPERTKALIWLYPHGTVREQQSRRIDERRETAPRLLTPAVYRPLLLLAAIFLFQQLSGAYVILFYTVDVFRGIGLDREHFSLISFGMIRFVMSIVSVALSRVYGRRPMLFASGFGMSVSCFAAFAFRRFCYAPSLVATSILSFVAFGALAFLNIPWTLIGELFPVQIKGAIGGFGIMIGYVFMFVVVKVFPLLMEAVDIEYIFLFFSVNCFFAVLVVYRWLPETFRVSFCDIEKYFSRAKR